MGIPKMFRFLTDRYPLILQRLDEDHVFDYFYLDMNGIIHQCTHPSDFEIAIENLDEMFARIFEYTERLFRIVSPRQLMFLAVDGVAPRAKMNQQRSRRFRSAKEAERNMADAIARGEEIPPGKRFDSNCITPGTQFMFDLSERFRIWIHQKMTSDPAWQQGCTVVFSGSEVPGEGEHKIMDFIRKWKVSPQYSPEVRHCMYGLDADLMMLGLVAHAPHFTLLREKIKFKKSQRKVPVMTGTDSDADEFQLLEIAMLRDMLFLEFKRDDGREPWTHFKSRRRPSQLEKNAFMATFSSSESTSPSEGQPSGASKKKAPFEYDSRRIVDDFVFMCMLVGNDFIPNIPHLDIAEGAINLMFRIYKHMLPTWGGYLTQGHRLHPERLESFLGRISQSETQYFEHRSETDGVPEYSTIDYRRKYYELKFGFDVEADDSHAQVKSLRKIYMEGLHWVLQYYHNGVPSWNWFYPDFYGILASDMKNLRSIKVTFQKGKPFRPLTQLMAVLPPESADLLPNPMKELMINPNSPVSRFYPIEFDVDQNGKRNSWEAVVVVPFIDERSLLREVNSIDKERELTDMEKLRDKTGLENRFHARDYPISEMKIMPVRPSKYYIPRDIRSRSPSPSSTRSRTSRSSSPRRSPSPRGMSRQRRSDTSSSKDQSTKIPSKSSGRSTSPSGDTLVGSRSSSKRTRSSSRTGSADQLQPRATRSKSPKPSTAKGRSVRQRSGLDSIHHRTTPDGKGTMPNPQNAPKGPGRPTKQKSGDPSSRE
ncbi:5'-3' exoribonuclease 4 [Gracilariopsis chorda]|uniref:5'-3' exoribonuclease 4 n=1 Tax=Gracilariopsis chorda TaxID=448386 RepID=A0A2V3IWE5_9FLOR|nr:5'-3' exoribonuclease 4 [Gracilariopsis chorda]|eukprot:PXF46409.1 5'-3' exoribonuclease 4 [Gracilariopsis chorda]